MTDAPEPPRPISLDVAAAPGDPRGDNPWVLPDFRSLWFGRLVAVLGIQIQSSALLNTV